MQILLGWILIIFPGILYVGQIISTISFPLAQRLGLQEQADKADALVQRAERYAAYWDLLTLGWLPAAGVLMLLDHSAWPLLAFFGAAIYLDTSGREAAKFLSFKHEGLRMGSSSQSKFFFSTYFFMAFLALWTLIYAIGPVLSGS
jgi:hypothetical protein